MAAPQPSATPIERVDYVAQAVPEPMVEAAYGASYGNPADVAGREKRQRAWDAWHSAQAA